MAVTIKARDNPWGHICRLISMLDAECLEQAIIQSWKCTIDAFKKGTGPCNLSTLRVQLQFIRCVHGSDLLEEERHLRGLLAQFEEVSGISALQVTTRVMLHLGYNLSTQRRNAEAEEIGLDVLSRIQGDEFYINKIGVKKEALQLVA
jgi:hypothetical protein